MESLSSSSSSPSYIVPNLDESSGNIQDGNNHEVVEEEEEKTQIPVVSHAFTTTIASPSSLPSLSSSPSSSTSSFEWTIAVERKKESEPVCNNTTNYPDPRLQQGQPQELALNMEMRIEKAQMHDDDHDEIETHNTDISHAIVESDDERYKP